MRKVKREVLTPADSIYSEEMARLSKRSVFSKDMNTTCLAQYFLIIRRK